MDGPKYGKWKCPSCGRQYEDVSVVCRSTKKHCQAPGCKDDHERELKKLRDKKRGKK